MDEQRKDEVEWIAAQAAEAALGLLPGGSVLGRALTLPLALAERRRNEGILLNIHSDIEALRQRRAFPALSELVESEEFMSSLYVCVRGAQATSHGEKRKLLRNALLNGVGAFRTEREEFLSLLSDYHPEHIAILRSVERLRTTHGSMPSGVRSQLSEKLGLAFAVVASCVARLVQDGMLSESVKQKIETEPVRTRYATIPATTEQVLGRETRYHSLSERGALFLEFVSDPL